MPKIRVEFNIPEECDDCDWCFQDKPPHYYCEIFFGIVDDGRLPQCIAAEGDAIDKKVSFLKKNLPDLLTEIIDGLPNYAFDDSDCVSIKVAELCRRLKEQP